LHRRERFHPESPQRGSDAPGEHSTQEKRHHDSSQPTQDQRAVHLVENLFLDLTQSAGPGIGENESASDLTIDLDRQPTLERRPIERTPELVARGSGNDPAASVCKVELTSAPARAAPGAVPRRKHASNAIPAAVVRVIVDELGLQLLGVGELAAHHVVAQSRHSHSVSQECHQADAEDSHDKGGRCELEPKAQLRTSGAGDRARSVSHSGRRICSQGQRRSRYSADPCDQARACAASS
jgi:hypothetical protein